MRKETYTMVIVAVLSLNLMSCSNDNDDGNVDEKLNGTYAGTFTVAYANGDTFSNPVTVNFSGDSNYESSANGDRLPAGGSGTYEMGSSKIDFSDTNIWTADFDWNLILNGEYDLLANGNELIISVTKNNVGSYRYELTKE
ncbi:hypothetical protein [Flagellimonas allohymeniacidonis]|uniref:Lipocalin-like domain-containing protein n=1 Tax=Flagellimonas allohymeniacidonis TaxID=2517819 RepID=A0A4Q8QJQ6_9FLAO|nr:hypothetical protein [Allomuricauda hymeniacidonis]TAI49558.1 hypothetical protein EW142_07100 [Allomuricauda hymeniacidonis]